MTIKSGETYCITVSETANTAEVTQTFDSYKQNTDADTDRLKSELSTAQIAASAQISETEIVALTTRVGHKAEHINSPETANRAS